MKNVSILLAFAGLLAAGGWAGAGEQYREHDPLEGVLDGEEPGEAGEEAIEDTSFVRVLLDSDVVYLRDGSKLDCTVIMSAAKAVIVLTDDGEQMIPSEDIERIVRAKDHVTPTILPVRQADGFKFIVMEPVDPASLPMQAEPVDEAPETSGEEPSATSSVEEPPTPIETPRVEVRPEVTQQVRPEDRPETLKKLTTEELQDEFEGEGDVGALIELLERAKDNPQLLEQLDEQMKQKHGSGN